VIFNFHNNNCNHYRIPIISAEAEAAYVKKTYELPEDD